MYKQRLEKFYRDHPRGLGDSSPNNEESITATASVTRHQTDGLDQKKCIQELAQVGVGI
jgi:hypothetical protein